MSSKNLDLSIEEIFILRIALIHLSNYDELNMLSITNQDICNLLHKLDI